MSRYTTITAREYRERTLTIDKKLVWTSIQLPKVRRVFTSTISNQILPVKPLSIPSGMMTYGHHYIITGNQQNKKTI